MSEPKKQKAAKPKVEDVILNAVKQEHQKAALEFAGFIRANKMTPAWASQNAWKVSYRGNVLCYIRTAGTAHYHNLDDGSWHINFAAYSDFVYDIPVSGEAVKGIWDNLRFCQKCTNNNCAPAKSLTINGKRFDKVCHQWLVIKNPDSRELDCMKKLVIAIRQSISDKDKS